MLDCTKKLIEVCKEDFNFSDDEVLEAFGVIADAFELTCHMIGQMSQDEIDERIAASKA